MVCVVCILLSFTLMNIRNIFSLPFSSGLLTNIRPRPRLSKAIQKYFVQASSLSVMFSEPLIEDIYSINELPVVVSSREHLLVNCDKVGVHVDGYIFVILETTSLTTDVVKALQCYNKTAHKMRNKRILVVDIITSNKELHYYHELYVQYFHRLWSEFRIVHLVIYPVFDKNSNYNSTNILAYNPFIPKSFSKTGTLLKLNLDEDFVYNLNKRFHSLHGYCLNAIMMPSKISEVFLGCPKSLKGGPDITFLWELKKQFNISFNLHKPSDGEYGSVVNGTPTDALAGIIDNKDEIILSTKMMKWYHSSAIQYLMPRKNDYLIVAVKKRGHIHGWWVILHIFHVQIWLWIVSAITFSCIISCFISRIYLITSFNNQGSNLRLFGTVIFVLKATLSMPVLKIPKQNPERILMTACLLFSVVVVSVFSGQLFYLIKSKPSLPNINSLEELKDSNLPIFTPIKNFMDAFDGLQHTPLGKLKERLRFKKSLEYGWDNEITRNMNENFALLHGFEYFRFYQLTESKRLLEKVHILNEKVVQFYLGHMMPLESVFYGHFNLFSVRLFQLGFFTKWEQEYLLYSEEQSFHQEFNSESNKGNLDSLTLYDLKLPFVILSLGLLLSSIVFFVEIYMHEGIVYFFVWYQNLDRFPK